MNTTSFLTLLTLNGHNGDTMCLATIQEKLALSVATAYSHYSRFLSKTTLSTMTATQIFNTVKSGKTVWTSMGLIAPLKGNNLPVLNGKILMVKDLEVAAQTQVIVL